MGYDRVDHHARRGADAIQRERGIVPDRVPDGPVVQSERTDDDAVAIQNRLIAPGSGSGVRSCCWPTHTLRCANWIQS